MKQYEVEEYLAQFPDVIRDESSEEDLIIYKVGQADIYKIFALIVRNSSPLRIELRCDEQLARRLRDTYETVLPGKYTNKRQWNTIILTGQVPDDEIKSFIDLSYRLSRDELQTV